MTEPLSLQTIEMWAGASTAEIPAQIRNLSEESVKRAREAYGIWAKAAGAGAKAIEELVGITQAATRVVGEKVVDQTLANAEVALAAAEKLARAKTLTEVANLQAEFARERIAAAGTQSQALIELATRVSNEAGEAIKSTAFRTVEIAGRQH